MDNKQKIIEPNQPQPLSEIQPNPTPTIVSMQPDQKLGNKKSDKLLKVVVIILSIGAVCFIVLAAAIIIPFAGMFNKCNTAANQAQTSANNAVGQLNAMTLLNGRATHATPQVSGDCIDTRTHDGAAQARFDVGDTFANLDSQISSNLTSLGYHQEDDFRYVGGTGNINDTYVNYRKDGNVISVSYSLAKNYQCPQRDGHIRECDKSDQTALMQQRIRKVEVTLYPAGGSHSNQ